MTSRKNGVLVPVVLLGSLIAGGGVALEILSAGSLVHQVATSQATPLDANLKHLVLDVNNAELQIKEGKTPGVAITSYVTGNTTHFTSTYTNGTLKITPTGNVWFRTSGLGEWVHHERDTIIITLPKGVTPTLALHSDNGESRIDGAFSTIQTDLGNGSLTLSAAFTELHSNSGNGDVNITARAMTTKPRVTVIAGNGSATADLTASGAAAVTMHVNNGAGTLTLPAPYTQYDITSEIGNGDLTNQVGDTNGAAIPVALELGNGDMKIMRG